MTGMTHHERPRAGPSSSGPRPDWHLDNIRRLQDKGIVRLAGICELTPLTEERTGRPGHAPSSPPTSAPCSTPPAPGSR